MKTSIVVEPKKYLLSLVKHVFFGPNTQISEPQDVDFN